MNERRNPNFSEDRNPNLADDIDTSRSRTPVLDAAERRNASDGLTEEHRETRESTSNPASIPPMPAEKGGLNADPRRTEVSEGKGGLQSDPGRTSLADGGAAAMPPVSTSSSTTTGGAAASNSSGSGGSASSLLSPDKAGSFSQRWTDIQTNFVDEPQDAVRSADGLVSEVIQELSSRFAQERQGLEHQWSGGGDVSTEDLRMALRHYRDFFQRLLAA
jgi:hypothetical protein